VTGPYWLFGLPFDLLTLKQARDRIFAAANGRQQLVFATPNVSFLAQASRDTRFRDDILRADMSLADGMPIIWLGSLLGVPFTERVAGSDLLESLIAEPGPRPLRLFFFGGNPGAAAAALMAVNRRHGGLQAVGALDPGFLTVEEMSDDATLDAINRSNADFLVVALGAAKGHRWIEANRDRLTVPVISHLGAAINFVAGRLQRAPGLVQRMGLEWLWRIKEEPALFTRYARDGWFLLKLLMGFVVPEALKRAFRIRTAPVLHANRLDDGALALRVTGRLGTEEAIALGHDEWQSQLQDATPLRIELSGVTQLDALGAGWLYSACCRRGGGGNPAIIHGDPVSRRTLGLWRAEFLAGTADRQVIP
jgi:N-acetylglucosaminyldiphosphoundecaprenol N-acetyl-beta-D-mannosaminyltransferase